MPTESEIEAGIRVAGFTPRDTVIDILEAAERIRVGEPALTRSKWPGRVTSRETECTFKICPDAAGCRKGCLHQQPITWDDAPDRH